MNKKNKSLKFIESEIVFGDDSLVEYDVKNYFGHLVVAFTTKNTKKYYSLYPWVFAIKDEKGWHHYCGLPNKVETKAQALKRGWWRAKWLKDGTYKDRYK